jgi:hypothetical protein
MHISSRTFQQALKTMRECGRGCDECVVFLVENDTSQPLEVVHPPHISSGGGYEVESGWLGQFAVRQTMKPLHVRAQIHTHPGHAYHSETDDRYPMVGTVGFVSIVVPWFAERNVRPSDLYVCELAVDGTWHELNPSSVLEE